MVLPLSAAVSMRIAAQLPAGASSILVEVRNGELNWGCVFRVSDPQGHPIQDLQFGLGSP